MISITKKICGLALIGVLTTTLAACGNVSKVGTGNNNNNDIEEKQEYSEELSKYFPAVEGTVLNYDGSAEYGHTLTLNKVTEGNEELTLNFKGEIKDVSEGEGPSKEDLILETEYVVGKDSVKEIQKNEQRRHSQSIIREQVVLKLPLEEGESWEQKVNIDGKEYTYVTKIIEMAKDKDGKNLVKTETLIKDMEGYPENTYKEIKAFKEGKGLVEFQNIIVFPGASEGDKPSYFDFGYHLFELEE